MWVAAVILLTTGVAVANYPQFEPSHRMRLLLLPSDMRAGSVIYRLRGTDLDIDYPLHFDVADSVGQSLIRIDSLPCTATHTFCQGNVYLTRRLEPDRVYDMILSVRDSTGLETKVDATIKATRATSHFEDVFPYVPSLLMVPEDTLLGDTLGFVLARKSAPSFDRSQDYLRGWKRNTELEMWGSEKFRLYQTAGTRDLVNSSIKLTSLLDFEERTMYMLTIFALDPWTVEREDTRNIAGFQLPVVVTDVQDMPPVFTDLPPVTSLASNLRVGDLIMQVHAHDGDRGNARQVRYGLVSEKNPFTIFFNISEKTGEIILAKPLKELHLITRTSQPIILTVMAEEVKLDIQEPPALTVTANVALILSEQIKNSPPKFMNDEYVARLKENAPQGTALVFGASYITVVEDLDAGPDGVFALGLSRDNGTFEVSPTVAESKANFVLRVRNSELLDYEKRSSVSFQVLASELGPGGSGVNTSCSVTVYLEDENDNSPIFKQIRYQAQLPENVTVDTLVTQVSATDLDSGVFGRVAYTRILGYLNHSLTIDSSSGIILVATNNHGFDREAAAEYRFTVEAGDMDGTGNKATVPLVIKILDVNDETPEFERQVFEFILQPGLRNFTSRAFVKAVDKDAEAPNNIVRYEIINGNSENKFHLNEITGELTVRGRLGSRRNSNILAQGITQEAEGRASSNVLKIGTTTVQRNLTQPKKQWEEWRKAGKRTQRAADGGMNENSDGILYLIADNNKRILGSVIEPAADHSKSSYSKPECGQKSKGTLNRHTSQLVTESDNSKTFKASITDESYLQSGLSKIVKRSVSVNASGRSEMTKRTLQLNALETLGKGAKSERSDWLVKRKRSDVKNSEWAEELEKATGGNRGQKQRQDVYSYEDDDFGGRNSEDVLDSVIVLNVRAYDLGIPHRWQRAHVRIYPPESRARTMNFIVPGTNPDARSTEDLLRTLTGGRVTVQDIRPYTGREQATDLTSNDSHQDKSVVTATVIYESNSVVDLQQLEKRLTANKTQAIVEQSVLEYKSENRVLFWLLIFLLILVILAALLLLLCCLWQGCIVCPCFEIHKRKVIVSPTENGRFIAKERPHAMETKGVQAVYSGRREAWSAHYPSVHNPRQGDRIRVDNDTPNYTRNPTMLVEDVEGQTWDYDDRQRRTLNQRRAYEERHQRRSNGGTPRFLRSLSHHRRSPLQGGELYMEQSPHRGQRYRNADLSPVRHIDVDHDVHYEDRSRDFIAKQRRSDDYYDRDDLTRQRHNIEREDTIHRRNSYDNRERGPADLVTLNRGDDRRIDDIALERKSFDRNVTDDGTQRHRRSDDSRGPGAREPFRPVRPSNPPPPSDYGDEIIYREGEIDKPMEETGEDGGETHTLHVGENLSPARHLVNPDSDSLRRHEMERGSVARGWEGGDEEVLNRDQLYIRDGNAEILRLLTRGPRDHRPHTLVQESGKEILMARFMEDQGDGQTAGFLRDYLTQEYLVGLLHPTQVQQLQDTQSLPGHMESATQTECEAATQTDEPALLLPPQRNARSDNELSDDEDKPGRWRRGRRPNIKTPIMEEGESLISGESAHTMIDARPAMFNLPESAQGVSASGPTYTENKSSILRRRKLREKDEESSGEEAELSGPGRPSRVRERRRHPNTVQVRADSLNRLYRALKDLQQTGSLTELTYSEDEPSYLRKAGFYRRIKELSTTATTSSSVKDENLQEDSKPLNSTRSKSKYMDWYKNLSSSKPTSKLKKRPPVKKKDEDLDSGIALSSLLGSKKSKIEKKSVFTIAYDDVHTNNIRPDTDSSQKL